MLERAGVLLLCLLAPGMSHAETYTRSGLYSVVVVDWLHHEIPGGDVFTCIRCRDQVQISITSGPSFDYEADKAKLVELFNDRDQWEAFAKDLIQEAVPANKDKHEIDVYQTGLVTHRGKELLQLASRVRIGQVTSYDTSVLAIHKNRIMKITVNYFDGAINEIVSKKISVF